LSADFPAKLKDLRKKNQKLLNKLEAINNLPEDDQETVISFLDAFIKRRRFKELVHE